MPCYDRNHDKMFEKTFNSICSILYQPNAKNIILTSPLQKIFFSICKANRWNKHFSKEFSELALLSEMSTGVLLHC